MLLSGLCVLWLSLLWGEANETPLSSSSWLFEALGVHGCVS